MNWVSWNLPLAVKDVYKRQIESLFSIPGIGSEFVNSVTNRDYTMIMALTILFGSFIIIVNILTDLLVAFIDPRVKLEKQAS